ncbi:MAG: DUF4965 domain-containing protein [Bryobacteraceae bacterium]|nr:DUF4965 domain-containing protein [Bryobacteraceae bacterium]
MAKFLLPLLLCLTAAAELRPPATPLVVHDPYFSIWSFADELTTQTRHWTGTEHSLAGVARIDGKSFRFMGQWRQAPAGVMKQTRRELTPTRTTYEFEQAGVGLSVTFFTPAFANDLDVLSRPASYVVLQARSADGSPHDVELYLDAAAHIAVNTPDQRVVLSRAVAGPLDVLRAGTAEQAVLAKSGDNLRIDWGHLYLAVPRQEGVSARLAGQALRNQWAANGEWPESDDLETGGRNPGVLSVRFSLGQVGTSPVSRRAILAYDDIYSIQYLQRNLRPWWRRTGMTALGMLRAADSEFGALLDRATKFDAELIANLRQAGGEQYAEISVLAYRQTLAAHKLAADIDGTPLYFSKENFSNGCIATVDVTYPSAPFMLALSPRLMAAMLDPIYQYSSLPRWRFAFAPHDLGTYPLANGQVYGGGEQTEENQMPVEESGNMLILAAALAEFSSDTAQAVRYWPVLSKWAAYLKEKGMDPENQLCTDDFAGHLARNANLSIKAIVALGAYSKLAAKLGHTAAAAEYGLAARSFAQKWMAMAADGDHTVLAFGQPGTWSQKYNLVWDRLLGLNLFPAHLSASEVAHYKSVQKTYGLPLDNRSDYTKLDWIIWSATLADNQRDFEALVAPVHRFLNESPSRVPMTDWYWTHDAKQRGFQARSVVGGVFIKLLTEAGVTKRWAGK